jgi:hypothetical protein
MKNKDKHKKTNEKFQIIFNQTHQHQKKLN